MKKIVIILFFVTLGVFAKAQTSTFQITYHNASPQAEAAINNAASKWGNLLVSSVPIKLNVHWVDASSFGFLGLTISNGIKDFQNAPIANTWYPSSLADAIAGIDLQVGDMDMDIFLDSTRNWYYGLDGHPSVNQFDLVDVALHEIGHGLGFYSIANIDQQGEGSFSLEFDPLIAILASFPIPNLQGEPMIYDRFVENQQGDLLIDTSLFANPSTALTTAFQSGQLFFNGLHTVSANGGNRPKLYAPITFAFGSSFLHLNEFSFPSGTPDAMMTPFSASGEAVHHPGPVTLGILQDIGWMLNPVATNSILTPNFSLHQNYPNPFDKNTTITFFLEENAKVNLKVFDLLGQEIVTLVNQNLTDGLHQIQWNGKNSNGQIVSNGMYIYQLQIGNHMVSKKMYIAK